MKLLVCLSSAADSDDLVGRLDAFRQQIEASAAPSLDAARDALLRGDFDALLVDPPLLDRALTLRRAAALTSPERHRFVLATTDAPPPLLIRAAHFGFDGLLDPTQPDEAVVSQLLDIVAERTSVQVHPGLLSLDIIPGLFSRALSFTDETDEQVVDLVSLGLSDRDIATVLGVTVQFVRNKVGRIIKDHGLSTRTQLAALYIRGETLGNLP